MQYIKRQYSLQIFIAKIKKIFEDNDIATNYLSRQALYRKIKVDYFGKIDPLNDKKNNSAFPTATKNFKIAQNKGHNLESMENNLDFLDKEYDSYIDELIDSGVLREKRNAPQEYYLNRLSPRVYWEIFIISIMKWFLELFPTVVNKN